MSTFHGWAVLAQGDEEAVEIVRVMALGWVGEPL